MNIYLILSQSILYLDKVPGTLAREPATELASNRYVFESIVEKVIMGDIDEDGKVDPYKLTFVYKTGFKDGLNGKDFKYPRKNVKKKTIGKDSAELSSYTNNHLNKSCSHSSDDTCGDSSTTMSSQPLILLVF